MKGRRGLEACNPLVLIVAAVLMAAGIIVEAFPPNSNSIFIPSSSVTTGTPAIPPFQRAPHVDSTTTTTMTAWSNNNNNHEEQYGGGVFQSLNSRSNPLTSSIGSCSAVKKDSCLTTLRAGAASTSDSVASGTEKKKCPFTAFVGLMSSLWGAGGVVYILAKAIIRVLPIALEPFQASADIVPLTQFQLGAYILTCLFFAYAEGYKGFQRKFSPLVVARSFSVTLHSPFHHHLFAPLYSMGLFHATKKRMIVSWSVTLGVATVVALVKRLPYPWRNIVDAGVVIGLTWGSICIAFEYLKALFTGNLPDVDPALPPSKPSKKIT